GRIDQFAQNLGLNRRENRVGGRRISEKWGGHGQDAFDEARAARVWQVGLCIVARHCRTATFIL
ncbi:MAG TPA: hypothetical protein VNT33_01345, partial [Telluria sp.]|nr:hypothetical protein [Telluria sp.]